MLRSHRGADLKKTGAIDAKFHSNTCGVVALQCERKQGKEGISTHKSLHPC